ncbi:uncharacterized protein LOC130675575 [Microplitis mediator]|uniref:uncharacterized protein LOC130675575 n=1 Tax=Microplitis mediator TaxID=375433 RepID=UPI002553A646|nr:uncharacterized protein LOC130675575 [Microplitis mediator]
MNPKILFLIFLMILLPENLLTSKFKFKKINLPKVASIGYEAIKIIMSVISSTEESEFQQGVIDSLDNIIEQLKGPDSLIKSEADRIIEKLSVKIDMQHVYELQLVIDDINRKFDQKFVEYFKENNTYHPETINNFVHKVIHDDDFIKVSVILDSIVPTNSLPHLRDKRLFDFLHDYLQSQDTDNNICDLGVSRYQILFDIYTVAVRTIAKGYVMKAYAYKYRQLQLSDSNQWITELYDVKNLYQKSVVDISKAARDVMANEPKVISRCDPQNYIEGVNYKRYQFLSLYITSDHIIKMGIDYYRSGRPYHVRTAAFCDGYSYSCRKMPEIIQACLAPPESGRRYNYIGERGGIFDGNYYYKGHRQNNEACYRDIVLKDDHNTKACFCREPYSMEKGALLNLTAQYTDIANNRVVTGIRFVTKWSITYIEIQDGQLVNGTIDPTTVRWNDEVTRKLEDYEKNNFVMPNDFYWNKNNKYKVNGPHIYDNPYDDDNIIDLGDNSWSFDLDDIILPPGMVVTGVQLSRTDYNHISLKVAGTEMFDIVGDLSPSTEIRWFSADDDFLSRDRINLRNLDVPTLGQNINRESSQPGKNYVKFELTDYIADASQTLIPFMDIQPIVTNPPAPIGGVGIYYKNQNGYGGFISLKLFNIDNSIFMFNEYFMFKLALEGFLQLFNKTS